MGVWLDSLMVVVALTNLAVLASSRLQGCIRLTAMQGVVVGLLPLLIEPEFPRSAILSVAMIALKGVVFPWLLSKALRTANVRREVEPLVDYTLSVVIGLLILGGALWIGTGIPLPVEAVRATFVLPTAVATMASGLFLIISRRKAINQVLGYIVMENGIYTMGLVLMGGVHLLIELGILLDVFVAVFVMGIAVNRISREFDHMDTDQLSSLKG
jgi:hydrogenase-4 component E